MDTRVFAVYNLARGVLLNSEVTVTDSANQPLKLLNLLVSGLGLDSESGLWLTPLHAVPGLPRVFPFDLLYLDKDYRVLETTEVTTGVEFPAYHAEVASALVLPSDTLRSTKTGTGDRLIVCFAAEMGMLLAAADGTSPIEAAPSPGKRTRRSTGVPTPPAMDPAETIELSAVSRGEWSSPIAVAEIAARKPASEPTLFERTILNAVKNEPTPPFAVEASSQGKPRRQTKSSTAATDSRSKDSRLEAPPQAAPLSPPEINASRRVPPAILEHHGGVEDLFSNWIDSPSEAPLWVRESENERPEPPTAAPAQSAANQAKPSVGPETPNLTDASSKADPAPTKREVKPRAEPEVVVPQHPPATTFTTAPYGMWRVSTPTGAASLVSPNLSAVSGAPPVNGKPGSGAGSPNPTETKQTGTRKASKPDSGAPRTLGTTSGPSENGRNGGFTAKEPVRDSAKPQPAMASESQSAKDEQGGKIVQGKPAEKAPQARVPGESPSTKSGVSPESNIAVSSPRLPKPESPLVKPPSAPNGKNIHPQGGLRSRFKQWLNPVQQPSDRRRALRRYVPGMIAHYFTGGAPKPYDVADISMTGFYLLTEDCWMAGTMIQMTLQKPCAKGERKQSITVLSRIVRRGSDGVAAEFVMPEAIDSHSHDIQPSQTTDRFALARFL